MKSFSASMRTAKAGSRWLVSAWKRRPVPIALELTGETKAGETSSTRISFSHKFAVIRGKYPKIAVKLNVEGKFTEPTPEQVKQIQESQEIKKDYLNRVTAEREWSGQFTAPVEAPISDVFGSVRIFNGKTSSPHQGLDFRVPSGTPVAAMNDGTVLLARPLYFEGGFVVIDHGQGLLTLYLHLSEFKVKEGEQVKRGQEIGAEWRHGPGHGSASPCRGALAGHVSGSASGCCSCAYHRSGDQQLVFRLSRTADG